MDTTDKISTWNLSHNIPQYLMVIVILWAISGCSNPGVTTPGYIAEKKITERFFWGIYSLRIDTSTQVINIYPKRNLDGHINITPLLLPPYCSDCITAVATGPYSDYILPVDITLKNPSGLTGYDVRGILISDTEYIQLLNPDNHTPLFDNVGPVTVNPFKAYAKTSPDRNFGPDDIYTENYEIFLSQLNKIYQIDYVVDVAWPGRVPEPYEITVPILDGKIEGFGYKTVNLSVDILSANDNVDEAYLDCISLGFPDEVPLTQLDSETWGYQFYNNVDAAPGFYDCSIRASTSTNSLFLYRFFQLEVVEITDPSFKNHVQAVFDAYCVTCHSTPEPAESLDLSFGNSYSNLVNVPSVQSALLRVNSESSAGSYLIGKLLGLHEFLPYNGYGEQMPPGGFLPAEELFLIFDWIDSGAPDN